MRAKKARHRGFVLGDSRPRVDEFDHALWLFEWKEMPEIVIQHHDYNAKIQNLLKMLHILISGTGMITIPDICYRNDYIHRTANVLETRTV